MNKSQRETPVMIFYGLLTWLIFPYILNYLDPKHKEDGFFLGFAVSMVLYRVVGRKYIEGNGDYVLVDES